MFVDRRHCIFLPAVLIFFLVFFRYGVIAQQKVFVNEFLIEPTPQSVEIINIGSESADISNWYIDDSGGATYFTIPQGSVLYPNSCAVFTGDFNFNKSSADTIRLFDGAAPPTSTSARLIDSFSYKSSSGSGVTFFRLPDGGGNWTTGSATLGNYNTTNQSCIITPSPTLTPLPTQIPTPITEPTPSPTPMSYDGIYISEAYVYPQSGEHEWIEFYNDNEFSVTLIGWFVDDQEDTGSSPKAFAMDIPAKGYAVFELSSSMFNNNGDSVRLLDFNKNLKDSFEYGLAAKGKSFGRMRLDDDIFCQEEPSKGIKNNDCINPTPIETPFILSPTAIVNPTRRVIRSAIISSKISTRQMDSPTKEVRVLGISTQRISASTQLIQSLSFSSFLYPLLTIVSIFLKIKKST